jgi:hypothetical protein
MLVIFIFDCAETKAIALFYFCYQTLALPKKLGKAIAPSTTIGASG